MFLYWFNVAVLFLTFIMSLLLFLALFEKNSIVYTLPTYARMILKGLMIMLCIGQLHSIEADYIHEVHLDDIFRDLGILGLVSFVYLYILVHCLNHES